MKESEDIKRADADAGAMRDQIKALDEQIQAETQRIAARFDADAPLDRVTLTPKRGQVTVQFVALGWVPDGEQGA